MRDWRRVNLLFLVASVLQAGAEGHLIAFTPLLLREMGHSEAEVATWTGVLYAAMMVVATPLAPFWGAMAERFSRRAIILRSFYFSALAYLISSLAPDVTWLIIGRLLLGLCFGSIAVITATQAMITPRRHLGTAIATVQAAVPIASSLGPPIGSLLIPLVDVRGLFMLDAIVVALAAVAMTILTPEPPTQKKRVSILGRTRDVVGIIWRTDPLRWNFLSAFLIRGATSVIDSYLPVRITQVADDPASAIGWVLGIYGALTALGTWLLGRVIDRIEEAKLVGWAMLGGAAMTFGMAVATDLWVLGLLAAARAGPAAMSGTVLFTHVARITPREHQTVVLSLSPMPRNAGSLLFPILAALTASLVPGAALAVGGVSYLLGTWTGFQMARSTPPRAALERRAPAEAVPRPAGGSAPPEAKT